MRLDGKLVTSTMIITFGRQFVQYDYIRFNNNSKIKNQSYFDFMFNV